MREGNAMPDEGFTELAGPRVALRRFHPGDLARFVAYRSSEQVARFQSWDAPYPREEGERFIREIAKEHPDTAGEWFQFAVGLRSARQLIGDCAAMPHADDPRQCEIGFTIAPEHQGHGYATEAVRLLLTYLFTARGSTRLRFRDLDGNASTLPHLADARQSRAPSSGCKPEYPSAWCFSRPSCDPLTSYLAL